MEFESIPRKHPAGVCSVAQLPESSDKNRYPDVLPYDNTRVELVPTKENNTGYINASHVKVSSGSCGLHLKVNTKTAPKGSMETDALCPLLS